MNVRVAEFLQDHVLSLPMDPFGDRDLVAKTVSAIGSFDNRAPLDF